MAQLPNVKLKVHPSTFDRLMAVLEDNAASAADERDRMDARDLMEKRMRFSRLYPGRDGQEYASVQMHLDAGVLLAVPTGIEPGETHPFLHQVPGIHAVALIGGAGRVVLQNGHQPVERGGVYLQFDIR